MNRRFDDRIGRIRAPSPLHYFRNNTLVFFRIADDASAATSPRPTSNGFDENYNATRVVNSGTMQEEPFSLR